MTSALHPDYRHRAKRATAGEPLTWGAAQIKWYDLDEQGYAVDPATRNAARACVAAQPVQPGDVAGFVILHRCGPTFHFLLTSLWRGNNELWQTVAYADPPAMGFAPFAPAYPAPGQPRPTFCVWELGIVAHEAKAWAAYLLSDRSAAMLDRWRDDRFDGAV